MNRQEYLLALREIYTRNKEAGIRDILASGTNYISTGFDKLVGLGRQGLNSLHGWWHYLKEDPKAQRRLKAIRKASKTLNDEFKALTQNDIDRADAGIAAIDGLDRTYHAMDNDTEMKSGVKSVLDAAKDITRTGNIKKYLKKGVNKGHDAIKARYPSIQDTEDAVNVLLNGPEKKSSYSLGSGIAKMLLKQAMYKRADNNKDESNKKNQSWYEWAGEKANNAKTNFISEPWRRYRNNENRPFETWFSDKGFTGAGNGLFIDTARAVLDPDGFATREAQEAATGMPTHAWWYSLKKPLNLAKGLAPQTHVALFWGDVLKEGIRNDMIEAREKAEAEAHRKAEEDKARANWAAHPEWLQQLREQQDWEYRVAKSQEKEDEWRRYIAQGEEQEENNDQIADDASDYIWSPRFEQREYVDIPSAPAPGVELDPAMLAPMPFPEQQEERAIVDAPDRPYDMSIARHP